MRLSNVRGKASRRRNANFKRRIKLRAARVQLNALQTDDTYTQKMSYSALNMRALLMSLFSLDDKGRVVVKGERGRTPLVDPQFSERIMGLISL